MSKLTMVIAIMTLAGSAQTLAQSAPSQAELADLVTACNGMAGSPKLERRNIRACETLATAGRLALVEPDAANVYRRYREERRLACERRQSLPRGVARGRPC
jgi:hypothetical protein